MHPGSDSSYQVASLYVGDLKEEVTEQILWSHFSSFGQILSIKVCKDSTTANSLGYAYVNFRTLEEAEKAMNNMNYHNIEGRPCRIMWSMRDSQKRRSNVGNLFLKNIDPSIDSRALFEAFSVFGAILSCKLVTDSYGKSKGFGFIQFCNEKDAEVALEKANGVEFLNKKIVVNRFMTKSQRLGDDPNGRMKFTNVFCKNFGDELSTADLETIFGKFGKITSCVVMSDQNGKSKGFGFINFEKPECAEKAVNELKELKTSSGRLVYVSRAMKKAERVEMLRQDYMKRRQENIKKCHNLNVYIKPLDPEMTDEKLKEHFEKFGTIVSHRVMKDSYGKSRGFGFVCYSTSEEASRAIQEMDKKVIETKPLLVTLAQSKEERSRELMAQNMNRFNTNQMYPPNTFQMMYPPPPQFAQNFSQQRYPPISYGQRGGFQRGSVPMSTQVIPNHSRVYQIPPYGYQPIGNRPGRPMMTSAGQMGQQQMKSGMPRQYQQHFPQGNHYTQPSDGQTFMISGQHPIPVQTAVNFVSASEGNHEVRQVSEDKSAGVVLQQTSIPHPKSDVNEVEAAVTKIANLVNELYKHESNDYRARLVNTVADSVIKDIKRVDNEAALRGVIASAANFLAKGAVESNPPITVVPST